MSIRIVRDSKYRHVSGDPLKTKYEDLRLSTKSTESCGIRANGKFFVFGWESGGGGALAVIPNERVGRIPRDTPLITGHQGGILDFEFNPFNDNMLMTCSEDNTLKIWQIPDGGFKTHQREAFAVMEGHQKKVSFCTHNPVAGNIAASAAFDFSVKVWDMSTQEEGYSITVPDHVTHLKWNYTGSLLAACCKDKQMRIIDPRAKEIVASAKVHDGVKGSKCEWAGSQSLTDENNKIITTGFSSQAERQLGLWDMRVFSKNGESEAESLQMLELDQGTGALFPFFDTSTQMVFIAGKGDGNVRYFEMTPEDPYLYYVSQYSSTSPTKGFTLFPKRAVDVQKHEINRGLKLETTSAIPISFKVPRKSEMFQEDLYPHCPSTIPACTPEEWVESKKAFLPKLMSMHPDDTGATAAAAAAAASSAGGIVSAKDLKKQLGEANARIGELEKENAALKAEVEKLKAAAK